MRLAPLGIGTIPPSVLGVFVAGMQEWTSGNSLQAIATTATAHGA